MKVKTPQQRINKLVKELKNTPYQIGLVYLEELLIKGVQNEKVCFDTFISDAHKEILEKSINDNIINNRA